MTEPGSQALAEQPGVLFDLDGTLIDSVYQHVLAWQEALSGSGIDLSVWKIHRRGSVARTTDSADSQRLGPQRRDRCRADQGEVHGDKIILRGTVRSWAERAEAERVAWSTLGVSEVENHITVAPDPPVVTRRWTGIRGPDGRPWILRPLLRRPA
ncbi:MAG TPA: BON domain-containing protein [Pseudonocardiaceae bacterium]|nr:BON domain-containing protein [Pseudonocardiaceae bacterium]